MGSDKLAAEIAGHPVLYWTLRAFAELNELERLVVATRGDAIESTEGILAGLCSVGGEFRTSELVVECVPGGKRRQDSVRNGIAALPAETRLVAVHDAARPLITARAVRACVAAAHEMGAAACATPVTDTLKSIDEKQLISGSVDRSSLWALQTPQVFEFGLLRDAYEFVTTSNIDVTDETSAVHSFGHPVKLVENPDSNPKITYPRDLVVAQALLAARHGAAGNDNTTRNPSSRSTSSEPSCTI